MSDRQIRILPFEAFLDLLRTRGYGVSLHEYSAAAHLLARWEGVSVDQLGDALAALIGRSDEEVEGIRTLFNQTYQATPVVQATTVGGTTSPEPGPIVWLRRHAWTLAVAAAVVVILLAIGSRPGPQPAAPEVQSVVPPVVTPAQTEAVALPPPPAPEMPPPPTRVARTLIVSVAGVSFLSALGAFWLLKIREERRAWLRDAWHSVRATLPGPFHFDENVRSIPMRLPKTDVEDAATLLGRVYSRTGRTRELDVRRTTEATLRRGQMPTVVWKPRRVGEAIFVLWDVSQEMRLWEGKVRAFFTDLRRQGIALRMYYFDGDFTRVSERPHRQPGGLDALLRSHADSPVMIVSSGSGLAAVVEGHDRQWRRLLAERPRTVWLTPVSDVRLWPGAFSALPVDVYPMTRTGLAAAARQLADVDLASAASLREQLAREGRVTRADIERLKRLASVVPHPTPLLLDALRREFAPDVPDAAVLHLMNEAGGPSAPTIALQDEEQRFNANIMRRESPDLEAAVRRAVLDVFLDSEPLAGSAAHERWRIAVAAQRLQLADLRGSEQDAAAALSELQELSQGPMGLEVRESLRLVPATEVMRARTQTIAHAQTELGALSEESQQRLRRVRPERWAWPGLRELVPATFAAGLLLVAALGLNVLPARALEHLTEAYSLEYLSDPPALRLALEQPNSNVPLQVSLYRSDGAYRSALTLPPDDVRILTLQDERGEDWSGPPGTTLSTFGGGGGYHYQVRATLAAGNLAVSPWVWVPSDQLSFVLIDAAPWATVTITGGQTTTAAQQTPFTAALLPGTYQLHFENATLGPQAVLEQNLTVPTPNARLRVTMPGFDPGRTVDELVPDRTPAAAR